MPGSIHVSVLEAFNLPEEIPDGEEVAIKVSVGAREFQTEPKQASSGKTTPWSIDFVFPVLNLRDNLFVMLLNKNGEIISKDEIDTPSIVEKGSFDVSLLLNGGGNIHLWLSFVLTDEERRRIDIMRAAALKRREQEALKSTANTHSAEKETDSGPSHAHSAPVGNWEKDIEGPEVIQDSPQSAPQASDKSQSKKSEGIRQNIHQESSISLEPVGQLDFTGHHSTAKISTGKSDESFSQQNPIKINPTSSGLLNFNSFSSDEIVSQEFESGKLKEQTESENNGEPLQDLFNMNNANPSPSTVKDKIKAFETTRPKFKSPPRKNTESDAEHESFSKEHLDYVDTRRTDDSVGPFKSFPDGSVTALRDDSEVEHHKGGGECMHEREVKGAEKNLEPVANVDCAEPHEREVDGKEVLVTASKQKGRNIDLMGVSKQMLNGAIVGAISGAVLIAAGAFLWNTNPRKIRKASARQRSIQGTRR